MSWIHQVGAWFGIGNAGRADLSPLRDAAWAARGSVPITEDSRPDTPTVGGAARLVPYRTGPDFATASSMAAFSAFPIVFACLSAKAEDLSGIGRRVIRPDGSEVPATDPLVRLLSRPTVRGSGVLLWRQTTIDLELAGHSFVRVVGAGGPPGQMSLVRLDPRECTVVPWRDGQAGAVEYRPGGGEQVITLTPGVDVIMVRRPSTRPADRAVYGTGLVEVLGRVLRLSASATGRSLQAMDQGRPSMIVRPPDPMSAAGSAGFGSTWDQAKRDAITESLGKLFDAANGGVVAVGEPLKMETPQWTPRDLQALEVDQHTAVQIMAACGVPPARLGYPIANQQAARDQDRVYWTGLQGLAELIDDVVSNWVDSLPGYIGCRVQHDFRAIRSLQFAQDGAIQRAAQLVALGVRADVALTMQGVEVPVGGWARDPDPGAASTAAVDPSMDGEPPTDQTRPQGPQRSAIDAPDPAALDALARMLAQETP
ncbi:MAG: phage portal protein [Candidatus Limnocylindrus sp.]